MTDYIETTTDSVQNEIDYKFLYDYKLKECNKLQTENSALMEKLCEIEELLNFRNHDIEELELMVETLKEKSARLYGEVCGLKFAMRCREMFADPFPEEVTA